MSSLQELNQADSPKPSLLSSSKVSDADKAAFVSAVLANKPFRKTISCLGGRVQVTFASVPWKIVDLIDQTLADDERGKFVYAMACSFQSMVDSKGEHPNTSMPPIEEPDSWSDIEERFQEFHNMVGNEVSISVLSAAFREFQEILSELYTRVLQPDFWKIR